MAKIKRNNLQKDDENIYRFYKSKLPAVVWDPAKNQSTAEFVGGMFETKDKAVAQKLYDLGYPQVDPSAEQPPDIVVELGGQSLGDEENASLTGENKKGKPIAPVVVKSAE